MHRREGDFPIRALVLDVGSRRPLGVGVGAGGLAILSAIGEEKRAEIIARVAPSLADFGRLSAEELHEACLKAHANGAAVVQTRVSLGVRAVGLPFGDSMGQSIGALSVAALTQRLNQRRTQQVAELLKVAVQAVEQRLRQRAQRRAGAGRPAQPRLDT